MTSENHVFDWLAAYIDGELSGARLRQVEDHLQTCEECQDEMAALQRLSDLLQEAPPFSSPISVERFVDQVRLGLPPQSKPEHPGWVKTLHLGWQLVPLGLIIAWVGLQAFLGIGQAALLALNVPAELVMGTLGADLPRNLPDLMASGLFGSRFLVGLSVLWLIDFYLTALTSILFWGWLASWWVSHRAGE